MMGMGDDGRHEEVWGPEADLYTRLMLTMEMNNMDLHEGGVQGDIPGTSSMYHPAGVRPSASKEHRTSSEPPLSSLDATTILELQMIRHQGNRFFVQQNWAAAVSMYSQCINQALRKLENDGATKTTGQEKVNRVLLLTYSNRAEARLRLEHYEDALSDADEALKMEPKLVKALVRKGKAAHGLGLFEKACKAFKAALEESREEDSTHIVESLEASTTALKQSRTGKYDLSDFFLKGCPGEAPSCADFVGPVEIRRVGYGNGRRGLFATRSVKAGDLLLVTNPLAVCRKREPLSTLEANAEMAGFDIRMSLVWELVKRIRTSKRQMAQLYSLCNCQSNDEKEIPSMEMFGAGSDWVPGDWEKFEVDADLVSDIVRLNGVSKDRIQHNLWSPNGHNVAILEYDVGIWTLPSFANHSCSPNVIHRYIGDAIFCRAAVDIVEGEELTISYLSEHVLYSGLQVRQAATKARFFICKCARCLLEETLQQKLSKVSKAFPDLVMAVEAEINQQGKPGRATKDIAKLVDEIELVIQAKNSTLGRKEQGWIRATFLLAYTSKSLLSMNEGDCRLLALTLDSATSVCVGLIALIVAAKLLNKVQKIDSKHSQSYRLTLDRVLGIYKVVFGKQPKGVLQKLISNIDG